VKGVLLTHADAPLGVPAAEALAADARVERLVLAGRGPRPRRLARLLEREAGRVEWRTVDFARHARVSELFRCVARGEGAVNAVVHLPHHGDRPPEPGPLGVPARIEEARVVLRACRAHAAVRQLVVVGSAYVYRLPPGNANHLGEDHELDLGPGGSPDVRAWVDVDLLLREELREGRLRVAILRVPTVLAGDGRLYLSPPLEGAGWRARPAGYDPLCAIVADGDLAKAVRAALGVRARGVFNVAGRECLPLSALERWSGRGARTVPGPLLRGARTALGWLGAGSAAGYDDPALRYGFSLDTRRAEEKLGFRPAWRIGLSRRGEGVLRLEPTEDAERPPA
jgi:nucleoside-diphosphate-sugar epimerase